MAVLAATDAKRKKERKKPVRQLANYTTSKSMQLTRQSKLTDAKTSQRGDYLLSTVNKTPARQNKPPSNTAAPATGEGANNNVCTEKHRPP
jgi:hypothetical protein